MASPGDPGGVGARRPTSSVRKSSDEAPRPARPVSISPPCAREGQSSRRSSGETPFREHVLWTSFRLESASAVLPQLLLRDLQRQRMACLPRVSIEIYGRCPAPGPPVSHGDFRLGLAAKDARAGAPTAAPFPPPAPAGSVRCWRRAGLPRAVVRVCKEKCAIPDLEESVALNSLDPIVREALRPCLV